MMVDTLYFRGIRNTGLGADLAVPVPRSIGTWWQGVCTRIYRDVVIPGSGAGRPELLWESNFTDITEALRYWACRPGDGAEIPGLGPARGSGRHRTPFSGDWDPT